jgi:hypothetical protein
LGEVRLRDWAEIDEEKFLELPAPATESTLRWKFTPGDRFGYGFSETVSQKIVHAANGETAANLSREKNHGLYEFVGGRDRTALAMAKIQTQEIFVNDQPVSRELFEKSPASVCEGVMAEDGSVAPKKATGHLDARIYFQSLFALQPGGQTAPLGGITTRRVGHFKVGPYDCARLETEFEFSKKRPAEENLLRGRVVGYFAVAEQRFIRISAAIAASSRANAKNERGVWITSSLDAVTTCRLKLLEGP